MNCLKPSRKLGIVALAVLAALIPLSVLATTEEGADDDEGCPKIPLWRGLLRWFGPKDDKTVDEAVDAMAERLNLTEDETAAVESIAQEISDLREQLKTKLEELHGVIGPKVEAYRESMMKEGFHGRMGMRGMWRCMCWRPCGSWCPCEESSDEAASE